MRFVIFLSMILSFEVVAYPIFPVSKLSAGPGLVFADVRAQISTPEFKDFTDRRVPYPLSSRRVRDLEERLERAFVLGSLELKDTTLERHHQVLGRLRVHYTDMHLPGASARFTANKFVYGKVPATFEITDSRNGSRLAEIPVEFVTEHRRDGMDQTSGVKLIAINHHGVGSILSENIQRLREALSEQSPYGCALLL